MGTAVVAGATGGGAGVTGGIDGSVEVTPAPPGATGWITTSPGVSPTGDVGIVSGSSFLSRKMRNAARSEPTRRMTAATSRALRRRWLRSHSHAGSGWRTGAGTTAGPATGGRTAVGRSMRAVPPVRLNGAGPQRPGSDGIAAVGGPQGDGAGSSGGTSGGAAPHAARLRLASEPGPQARGGRLASGGARC